MPFRTVLVHAQDTDTGRALVEEAIRFAEPRRAHVVALVVGVQPVTPYATMVDVPLDGYAEDIARAREEVRLESDRISRHFARAGVTFEVRGVSVPPGMVGTEVARHARYADLSIFGKPDDSGLWHQTVDTTLFESGKPILIAPPKVSLHPIGRRAAIAWNAGREAARSVADALPLLEGSEDVRVVMVDPRVGPMAHGEEPGAAISTMLARHGLKVTAEALPKSGRTFADAFLAHARDIGADLLVCGAYGHSRLSEMLFGGATRDLMEQADRPVFMSH